VSLLPVEAAHLLAVRAEEHRWLIDGLWAEEAVGIVGGEPKCCKSFLALDMAVAVASGTACLRRYAVARPGRVLLFAAEDALHIVRGRLDGICRAAGVELANIDIQVITAPSVRLDVEVDRKSLAETVAALRPRLLILDPFVRLHRIDENVSGEVAPLLAYLRELQRRHQLAVVVVHHARKGAGKARAGQALRGSSEFHAWGDSNLYLRRLGEELTLAVEQRAAASATGISLRLHGEGQALALEVFDDRATAEEGTLAVEERVEQLLVEATAPMSVAELRTACHVRNATLHQALAALATAGRVTRSAAGYAITAP
jgi:RecA-family ATPase